MTKNLTVGSKRSFLNLNPSVSLNSMIGYSIELNSWIKELIEQDLYHSSDIDFIITDCNNQVRLTFDIDTEENLKNSVHKLDTIIDVCQSMKQELKIAHLLLKKGLTKKESLL